MYRYVITHLVAGGVTIEVVEVVGGAVAVGLVAVCAVDAVVRIGGDGDGRDAQRFERALHLGIMNVCMS